MIEDLKDELFAMFWGLPCFLQILRTGKYFGKREKNRKINEKIKL